MLYWREKSDGILLFPRGKLFGGSQGRRILIGAAVFDKPVRRKFNKHRAAGASAYGIHGMTRHVLHNSHVLTVCLKCLHTVTARNIGNGPLWLPRSKWGYGRVKIILTYKQHGQAPQRRKVHGFVGSPLLNCGIAEKTDGEPGFILHDAGECNAHGYRNRRGNDGCRSQKIHTRVNQVHGSAYSAA